MFLFLLMPNLNGNANRNASDVQIIVSMPDLNGVIFKNFKHLEKLSFKLLEHVMTSVWMMI